MYEILQKWRFSRSAIASSMYVDITASWVHLKCKEYESLLRTRFKVVLEVRIDRRTAALSVRVPQFTVQRLLRIAD